MLRNAPITNPFTFTFLLFYLFNPFTFFPFYFFTFLLFYLFTFLPFYLYIPPPMPPMLFSCSLLPRCSM